MKLFHAPLKKEDVYRGSHKCFETARVVLFQYVGWLVQSQVSIFTVHWLFQTRGVKESMSGNCIKRVGKNAFPRLGKNQRHGLECGALEKWALYSRKK